MDSKLGILHSNLHECVRKYFRVEHTRSEQVVAEEAMREAMDAVTYYVQYGDEDEDEDEDEETESGVPIQLELNLESENYLLDKLDKFKF